MKVDERIPSLDVGLSLHVEEYAYDEEGNRTASHLSATYASNGHNQLLEDEGFTYAYDAKGNRVSKTAKADGTVETYTYDSQNRLVGYVSDTTTASYAYDALERRVGKLIDGVSTALVYDLSTNERLAYDDITLEFVQGTLFRRWMHSTAVDEPVGYEAYVSTSTPGSGSNFEVYANHLGSIVTVVAPAIGQPVAVQEFDSFGFSTREVSAPQLFGFTGREHDTESKLTYMRARSYDTATGSFLQSDPIGFEGGDFNTYAYVGNNP